MIRVAIIADLLSYAHAVAELLAQDDRIHIIDVRGQSNASPSLEGIEDIADVLIIAGPLPNKLFFVDVPLVIVNDGPVRDDLFAENLHAWLPKDASYLELSAAIAAAAADLYVLTSQQRNKQRKATIVAVDHQPNTLTPRELEVLLTMAKGFSNKEIAHRLGISGNTVKFHIAQIAAKLGAHSRTEAVAIGMKQGLVPV